MLYFAHSEFDSIKQVGTEATKHWESCGMLKKHLKGSIVHKQGWGDV